MIKEVFLRIRQSIINTLGEKNVLNDYIKYKNYGGIYNSFIVLNM